MKTVILAGLLASPGLARDPAPSCGSAASEAEARFGLPPGLLLAIGRVESGRVDPATRTVVPWPWSINANGAAHVFTTAVDAVAGTSALQDQGAASIDVGCFQINLFHHPTAFSSLVEAFDPTANAAYAARFLVALHERLGSWAAAVAAYHSSIPERGIPYRDRVLAGLDIAREAKPATRAAEVRTVVWTSNPHDTGIKVWTPSAPGRAPNVISILPFGSRSR